MLVITDTSYNYVYMLIAECLPILRYKVIYAIKS